MDIYLTETKLYGGFWLYQVWVEGQVYDQFQSKGWLTNAQQIDVANGYAEALDGFPTTRPVQPRLLPLTA